MKPIHPTVLEYIGVSHVAEVCSQAVNHHRAVDTDSQRPERLCVCVCVRVCVCVCVSPSLAPTVHWSDSKLDKPVNVVGGNYSGHIYGVSGLSGNISE